MFLVISVYFNSSNILPTSGTFLPGQPVYKEQGYLSRYSDSLWAGRSVYRTPVEARFSTPVQAGSEAHPASYKMGTGSLPRVNRPGRGVDHPLHLAPRLKKEYSYTSTHSLGLRDLFQGELYLYLLLYIYI